MAEVLRVGSRASRLALVQTEWAVARLREAWPDLEVRVELIRTAGDRDRATPLAVAPAGLGVGIFVKELEQSLLDGRIDLAVHSMKDVPTRVPEGLEVEAAVPARADPRDCLVTPAGDALEDLARGAIVGTSSPRRRAMLVAARADLEFTDLRGNVETRLAKLEAGRYGAAVLARAGLERLGLVDARARTLPVSVVLPAAGQGALAVQCLAGDEVAHAADGIDDKRSREALVAERSVVAGLGAGCHSCLAVHVAAGEDVWRAWGMAARADGSDMIRSERSGFSAATAAEALLEVLEGRGCRSLLKG